MSALLLSPGLVSCFHQNNDANEGNGKPRRQASKLKHYGIEYVECTAISESVGLGSFGFARIVLYSDETLCWYVCDCKCCSKSVNNNRHTEARRLNCHFGMRRFGRVCLKSWVNASPE